MLLHSSFHFRFALFFFFLSVFFVERTSVILAENTWKRKTVFCIMWSNEHFTNRQRHKKKTELSSIYNWDSTGKTHSTLCGISAKHSCHDNVIRKDNFGRIHNSMLSIGDNLVLKTKSGNCLKEA